MISQRIASLFEGYRWLIIPAAFLTIVLHEMSHGFVAYLLGDRTAKNAGRLTLNPIKHIDIFGLFAMILFGFGWAKPVPVNPYYFKKRKLGMALTAFAGPGSNIIMALIGLLCVKALVYVPMQAGIAGEILIITAEFLLTFVSLNVGLAVFNLIPIPPLDGSKILNTFLPERAYFKIMQYERYGFLVLLILLNVPFFENLLTELQWLVYKGLLIIVGF